MCQLEESGCEASLLSLPGGIVYDPNRAGGFRCRETDLRFYWLARRPDRRLPHHFVAALRIRTPPPRNASSCFEHRVTSLEVSFIPARIH